VHVGVPWVSLPEVFAGRCVGFRCVASSWWERQGKEESSVNITRYYASVAARSAWTPWAEDDEGAADYPSPGLDDEKGGPFWLVASALETFKGKEAREAYYRRL
jgi:hypothetical protein